jgi:ubiquinone/menaquinone biosynthesis C-methylase UbiE
VPVLQHHAHHRATMYGLARHPGHYERFAAVLAGPLYRRVVADVSAEQLPAGAVVLDVGTGPGRVPMMIAEKCPQLSLIGVDLSPEMIAHATATRSQVSGPGQVGFQVADVARLPFADGSVDFVVSSISMHHWDDVAAGLREVVRVLRPGAAAWIYDVRPAIRRAAPATSGLPAEISVENPLPGRSRLNPIGRLVLRHQT